MHWYLIIYKAILGMLPSYLCCLIKQKIVEKYFLRSQNCYTLSVPFVRSELGKKAFMYAAPTDWNLLQSKLKLQNLLSLDHFKTVIRQMEIDSTISNQIKSLLLSHHHSTCALMSEILESVLHTVQKQLTYRQYHYILTDLYR